MAAAVTTVALVVYVLTLYPDVIGGDGGELIAAAASGGVPHPPGFPLYALLGRGFALLPLGTLAWRFNLSSAVCDALAAGLLFLAVLRWSGKLAAGLLAAALFAFSPGVWRYAISAEVFALNNLFVALLLLLAVLYAQKGDTRIAYATSFAFGLGLCDHHTLLLAALPLVAWALWVGRAQLLKPRALAIVSVCFLVGLLPYLYLPIAGARPTPVTWGATNTWHGFWVHVLRQEYGTFSLAAPGFASPTATAIVSSWADDLVRQIGWWGLPVLAVGLAWAWRDRKALRGFAYAALASVILSIATMALLGNVPTDDGLHRDILARFWQQPDLFLCAFAGLAVAAVAIRVPAPVALTASLLLAVLQLGVHWRDVDGRHNTIVRQYAGEVLRAAPPGVLIVAQGELVTNPVRYLQLAEGLRPDVRLVDGLLLSTPWEVVRLRQLYPEVVIPGRWYSKEDGGFSMKDFFDANIDRAPIMVCGGIAPGDHSTEGVYTLWPMGLCQMVHKSAEAVEVEGWIESSESGLPRIDFPGSRPPAGSWEHAAWLDYWKSREVRADKLLRIAQDDPAAIGYANMAVDVLRGIAAQNPEPLPEIYMGLAVAYQRLGLATPEQRQGAAEAWRNYLRVAPTDPKREAIEAEITRLSTAQ